MAGQDVGGVFHGDAFQSPMSRVADQSADGAQPPLPGVEMMGEPVLKGPSAGLVGGIVDLPVGGPEGREVLSRDHDEVQGPSPGAGLESILHCREGGVVPQDVGNPDHPVRGCRHLVQSLDSVQFRGKRLLDEDR